MSKDNVIWLASPLYNEEPISPAIILKAAQEYGNLSDVVIVGHREDGSVYASSSLVDGADILWLLELLRVYILPKPVQGDD